MMYGSFFLFGWKVQVNAWLYRPERRSRCRRSETGEVVEKVIFPYRVRDFLLLKKISWNEERRIVDYVVKVWPLYFVVLTRKALVDPEIMEELERDKV